MTNPPTAQAAAPPSGDYIETGFARIDRDFGLLLDCFTEMLREAGEPACAEVIEAATREVDAALPERGAQALAVYFHLLNLVEENTSNLSLLDQDRAGEHPGFWRRCLNRAIDAGFDETTLARELRATLVEPVLTKHPTEAKQWSILSLHRRLHSLLRERPENRRGPRFPEEIKATLELIWRTGELSPSKPDVRAERRNVLFFLQEVFPRCLNEADTRLDEALTAAGLSGQAGRDGACAPRPALRFGSWVGGDRDGHPHVTPELTAETLDLHRETAINIHREALTELRQHLSLSAVWQPLPEHLRRRLDELARQHPQVVSELLFADETDKPWQRFLVFVTEHLPSPGKSACYPYPGEFRADLTLLDASLREIGAPRVADLYVAPLIRLVDTFGFHLVSLDIRQNSAFHDEAVAGMLEAAGIEGGSDFADWPEARRKDFLLKELDRRATLGLDHVELPEKAANVRQLFRLLAQHVRQLGRAGLGSVIVSMTRQTSDLLAVYLFQREAGLFVELEGKPAYLLNVVPLFETREDLEASAGVVSEYLGLPVTRRSLPWQDRSLDEVLTPTEAPTADPGKPGLQVMLGYSDSNKDCGTLASHWAVRTAQQALLEAAQPFGVPVRFFHGRGGTTSRGAGPAHRFLEALPPGSIHGGLRLTEQGEVIAQKYNNLPTAVLNLELLLAGAFGARFNAENAPTQSTWEAAFAALARFSTEAYQGLIHRPRFMEFYAEATPIDLLEHARMGSRPSRRTGQRTLSDLRAIPWVFSWTQARFYLPGWFGFGAALARLEREEPELYKSFCADWSKWPFARFVIYNVESSLASSDGPLMSHYASLVADADVRDEFLGTILRQREDALAQLAALTGGDMNTRRPRLMRTVGRRAATLERLHREQVMLLAQWRKARFANDEAAAGELLERLLLTVNAIASGLRTTG